MQTLRVSQLPFVRPEIESDLALMDREGFVDEEVVKIFAATPNTSRTTAQLSDLVLSAEDLDFAGWNFPVSSISRHPEITPVHQRDDEFSKDLVSPQPLNFSRARPTAPEPTNHWWLAGLAGVITTVGFSFILVKLIAPNSLGVPHVSQEKSSPHASSQLEVSVGEH